MLKLIAIFALVLPVFAYADDGEIIRETIYQNSTRYLNSFARAHGGSVAPIQIRNNEGLTVSEFSTVDGYDCAMMATHNLILECGNPRTNQRIHKVVRVLESSSTKQCVSVGGPCDTFPNAVCCKGLYCHHDGSGYPGPRCRKRGT